MFQISLYVAWAIWFLILGLKTSKQEHPVIFYGTKAQTCGAQKEVVSVPYFTV